ncbi:MAG: DUF4258 domain-containing protein [Persephonella sp.]|nr:DUF4258 domain-containing protein [Persephonella sp.]
MSKHAEQRLKERKIKMQWIIETIENPDDIEVISKTEARYYKKYQNLKTGF